METYHLAWLSAHPERTEEWLKERLRDGFHVHHIDGDHFNDDPKNLVLIESGDHMMLHNGKTRLLWKPPHGRGKGGRSRKEAPAVSAADAQKKPKKPTKRQLRYIEQKAAARARFEASLPRNRKEDSL
jgi:hypothetical protein